MFDDELQMLTTFIWANPGTTPCSVLDILNYEKKAALYDFSTNENVDKSTLFNIFRLAYALDELHAATIFNPMMDTYFDETPEVDKTDAFLKDLQNELGIEDFNALDNIKQDPVFDGLVKQLISLIKKLNNDDTPERLKELYKARVHALQTAQKRHNTLYTLLFK